MNRIAKIAVAASIFAAIGLLCSWLAVGGSTSIAFAKVADAVDSLRSATYDITSEAKGEKDAKSTATSGKGYFLAPSRNVMSYPQPQAARRCRR